MNPRCGQPVYFVCGCGSDRCGGVCACVKGHPGLCGCHIAARQARAVASMQLFLANGSYQPFRLVGG